MKTNTAKQLSDLKGFGFITSDAGGNDLFVHFSEVRDNGFKFLQEGQEVHYIASVDQEGPAIAEIEAV